MSWNIFCVNLRDVAAYRMITFKICHVSFPGILVPLAGVNAFSSASFDSSSHAANARKKIDERESFLPGRLSVAAITEFKNFHQLPFGFDSLQIMQKQLLETIYKFGNGPFDAKKVLCLSECHCDNSISRGQDSRGKALKILGEFLEKSVCDEISARFRFLSSKAWTRSEKNGFFCGAPSHLESFR
jgi:hypothetical protein